MRYKTGKYFNTIYLGHWHFHSLPRSSFKTTPCNFVPLHPIKRYKRLHHHNRIIIEPPNLLESQKYDRSLWLIWEMQYLYLKKILIMIILVFHYKRRCSSRSNRTCVSTYPHQMSCAKISHWSDQWMCSHWHGCKVKKDEVAIALGVFLQIILPSNTSHFYRSLYITKLQT